MNTPKDQDEREVQEWIEKGMTESDAVTLSYDKADLAAYRVLFETLKERPTTDLSDDFSSEVLANIRARRDRIIDFRWNFMLPLSILVILAVSYLSTLYTNNEYAEIFLQLFLQFKWHILFSIVSFLVIQYLDHRLVKKRYLGSF